MKFRLLHSGDLNNEHLNNKLLLVRYSDGYSNGSPVFKCHSNNGLFSDQTTFDHLNTRLVRYSDHHCNCFILGFNLYFALNKCVFFKRNKYFFDLGFTSYFMSSVVSEL